MQKSAKKHFFTIPIIFLASFLVVYLPKPFESLGIIVFFISFVSCSIVGLIAAVRSGDFWQLFHPNPIRQVRVFASTNLNDLEKLILIYAIVILMGCLFGMIFSPAIGTVLMS